MCARSARAVLPPLAPDPGLQRRSAPELAVSEPDLTRRRYRQQILIEALGKAASASPLSTQIAP
jgi:hypothetical protein